MFFCFFVASSPRAYGQAIVGEIEEEKETPDLKKWTGGLEVTAMTDLDTPNEEQTPASMVFESLFSYRFSEKWSGQVYLWAIKDFGGKREEQLQDGYLGLGRSLWKTGGLTLSGSLRTYLPLNRIHRENKSFQSRVRVATALVYDFKAIGIPGLEVAWVPSFSRNFYRYNTSTKLTVNTEATATNLVQVVYTSVPGIPGLSLKGYFYNRHRWSTLGHRKPDVFLSEQEIVFALAKDSSVSVGHTNGGNTFYYDGTDIDIDFFDRYASSVYASWAYAF